MTWNLSDFDALSPRTLYALLAARERVFVVEQRCAYLDADGWDAAALHLWRASPDGEVEAYLRVFGPGVKHADAVLGRVLTSSTVRRTGVGRELVRRGLEVIDARWPGAAVRIHAQAYLERFYASFGFARVGADFDEDGIPHCEMVRT